MRRPNALHKWREGIASWLGVTVEALLELEKDSAEPGFPDRLMALLGRKAKAKPRRVANVTLVPLVKQSVSKLGPGRWAVVSSVAAAPGDIVAFETPAGWMVGRYLRDGDRIIVFLGGQDAKSWPKAEAPVCSPVVMTGELPDASGFA